MKQTSNFCWKPYREFLIYKKKRRSCKCSCSWHSYVISFLFVDINTYIGHFQVLDNYIKGWWNSLYFILDILSLNSLNNTSIAYDVCIFTNIQTDLQLWIIFSMFQSTIMLKLNCFLFIHAEYINFSTGFTAVIQIVSSLG